MKNIINRYKYHFLIIVIGLVWIHAFDWLMQITAQGIIYPDSRSYQMAASDLYLLGHAHPNRPIVMAAINGIPYLFKQPDAAIYNFSYYVNIFCWLGFFIILFEILKAFVRLELALLFSVLSMFFVGFTAYVYHLMTENIYMFFIISGFYFLLKYLNTKIFRYLSVFIVILILSMLVKPGSKFLAMFFIFYFIRELMRNYRSRYAILIYASLLLVLLQCQMVKYKFGDFRISYIDSAAWYNYLGTRSMNLKQGKALNTPRASLFSMDKNAGSQISLADFKEQIMNNPFNVGKAFAINIIENSSTGNLCLEECENVKNKPEFNAVKKFFTSLAVWQNVTFTVIGLLFSGFYLVKFRTRGFPFFVSLFILYIIFTSGISFAQGDVFHSITFPFALILIADFIMDRFKPFAAPLQIVSLFRISMSWMGIS